MIFFKYQGTGNDFVVVNNLERKIALSTADIRWLCDRKFGIGSDGLVLIEPHSEYDFNMIFYNPDGSKSFCGNGSRCAVAFARDENMIGQECTFMAIDGVHQGQFENDFVHISIRNPTEIEQFNEESCFIHTGSPHHVEYRDELESFDFLAQASNIRYSDRYLPGGSNVNFIKDLGEASLEMRTYERGVEAETLSCGSGVTAAALAHHKRYGARNGNWSIQVNTKGGKLMVQFDFNQSGYNDIWLKGPAKRVFTGEIILPHSLP
jgi:diaminopimelate epimerase